MKPVARQKSRGRRDLTAAGLISLVSKPQRLGARPLTRLISRSIRTLSFGIGDSRLCGTSAGIGVEH